MAARKPKVDIKPEDEQRVEKLLCFAVYSTAHAFTRAYKPILDKLGLTYPQYLAMLVLWEKDDMPVKAIGEQLDLDSGTLSPLLKRLEAAGLIVRRRHRDDERQVLVSLTPKGAEMKKEVGPIWSEIGRAVGCDLEDVIALRDTLHRVRKNLTDAASELHD
ncbi:MarR family winged helix-turn-helix transcriptional regulator [Oryzifoliimicrobium ureilyticus]|uniref:MarR family winged helix-turn-helix transcriptional regulator n=1 Tax=Oryzifoliimicrobium ureilyticus TaxID=3113724 RepID=UPI0030762ACA